MDGIDSLGKPARPLRQYLAQHSSSSRTSKLLYKHKSPRSSRLAYLVTIYAPDQTIGKGSIQNHVFAEVLKSAVKFTVALNPLIMPNLTIITVAALLSLSGLLAHATITPATYDHRVRIYLRSLSEAALTHRFTPGTTSKPCSDSA